jgi:alanine racemase
VHLKIDTGMNRLGFRAEEMPEAAAAIARMDRLKLEGAYTHFACANEDDEQPSRDQLMRLEAALADLKSAGMAPPLVHAANSAAILKIKNAHFDMVRSGLALYGIRPCAAASRADLRPALALRSRVVHLKRVRRGEGVSYGHRWKAPCDSLLGVLPVGYADGYRRLLSNRAQVRIAGRLCPVRGTICMDATMVDLTDVPGAEVGMEATLLEASHDSPLSAGALAELCDTIAYEILTGISGRVPRVYIG